MRYNYKWNETWDGITSGMKHEIGLLQLEWNMTWDYRWNETWNGIISEMNMRWDYKWNETRLNYKWNETDGIISGMKHEIGLKVEWNMKYDYQ